MSKVSNLLFSTVCGFGLVSCASLEKPASAPEIEPMVMADGSVVLPPLGKSEIVQGFELHRIDEGSGNQDSWKAIEVNDSGDVTALNTDGCTFQFQSELFSPILMWENCGSNPKWNTGNRKIVASTGSLWPLVIGNKADYEHDYEFSSGNKGSGVRSCEVTGTEMSTVPMGEYAVFVVQCRDDFGDKYEISTWHISPEVGEIRYMREHSENGLIKNVGVERIVLPNS